MSDYEKQVQETRMNLSVLRSVADNPNYEPTAWELLMNALGYDPSQDGLYLCREGCGITHDHECDYGGWHGDVGRKSVRLSVHGESS